jgi:hypothetical protein
MHTASYFDATIYQSAGPLKRWLMPRLFVYFGAAVISAALFFIWATVYVYIYPAPTPQFTPQLKIQPLVHPEPKRDPIQPPARSKPKEKKNVGALVALLTKKDLILNGSPFGSAPNQKIIGSSIFDSEYGYIGNVADVIRDNNGNILYLIIAMTDNDWRLSAKILASPQPLASRKATVVPSSEVAWTKPDEIGIGYGIIFNRSMIGRTLGDTGASEALDPGPRALKK